MSLEVDPFQLSLEITIAQPMRDLEEEDLAKLCPDFFHDPQKLYEMVLGFGAGIQPGPYTC